jgi:hypothetical protein
LTQNVDNAAEHESLIQAYHEMENYCAHQDQRIQALETDQEDLLLCLADQELEIQHLKERLKGYGEVFPDDDTEDQ